MRVIECDVCGHAVTAADDRELAQRLGEHLRTDHERQLPSDEVAALIEAEAYEAMDS
jgi:predicted small metal-binding protein